MKKLLALLFFSTFPLWAASTTTRVGIAKPDDGTTSWGTIIRNNYDIIDSSFAVLNATQTFTAGQTISSATITSLRSNQVLIGTPTYTISTDKLAANGAIRSGGSSGIFYACDSNFRNCSSLDSAAGGVLTLSNSAGNSVYVRRNGAVQAGLELKASTVSGAYVLNESDLPGLLSADHLIIGTTFGNRISNYIDASGTRSAIENSLYIGTHTVSGTPQFAVVGSTSNAYSVLVGTSSTLSGTNYHVAVSTTGNVFFRGGVGLWNLPVTTINSLIASTTGQEVWCKDCTANGAKGTPCYSSGTTTTFQFILSTGTRCQ